MVYVFFDVYDKCSGTSEWSGVYGCSHVMRTGTKTRFSAGLFSVPKKDHLIYAPDEMVDAEHPRLFKPFDFESYFQFTTEGPGRRDLAALRTYCGL